MKDISQKYIEFPPFLGLPPIPNTLGFKGLALALFMDHIQLEDLPMAVKLKNSGQTYAEISKTIDVHPSTICAWYKAY